MRHAMRYAVLAATALLIPAWAHAIPMLVTLQGEIEFAGGAVDRFGFNVPADELLGVSVLTTYRFDTEDGGDGGSGINTKRYIAVGENWIESEITVTGAFGTVVIDDNGPLANPVGWQDQIDLSDEGSKGSQDMYSLFDSTSSTTETYRNWFWVMSNIRPDHLITALNLDQTLIWTPTAGQLAQGFAQIVTAGDSASFRYNITSVYIRPVPEPGTAWLLLAGLLGLIPVRRVTMLP